MTEFLKYFALAFYAFFSASVFVAVLSPDESGTSQKEYWICVLIVSTLLSALVAWFAVI